MPDSAPRTCQIDFEPIGKRVDVAPHTTLLEAAQQAGLALSSACGGVGNCGQCRVTVLEGQVSPPTTDEKNILTDVELLRGDRLACCTRVHSRVKIHVPKSSRITEQRLQLGGDAGQLPLDPLIRACRIDMSPPTLHDPRSDVERITAVLTERQVESKAVAEPAVIRLLSPLAREHNWRLTAYLRDAEIIGLAPPKSTPVGMAVDLGTTKIAASLVDLLTGAELAVAGALNPQIGYGEDVISRLTYARRHTGGGHVLATLVRETLDNLLGELTEAAGVNRTQVADICIVGNTAMTHLLAELACSPVGRGSVCGCHQCCHRCESQRVGPDHRSRCIRPHFALYRRFCGGGSRGDDFGERGLIIPTTSPWGLTLAPTPKLSWLVRGPTF